MEPKGKLNDKLPAHQGMPSLVGRFSLSADKHVVKRYLTG